MTLRLTIGISEQAEPPVPVRARSGTSETLSIEDAGVIVVCTNSAPITLNVPPEGDVPFLVGTYIEVHQGGAGVVTIAEGAGVTINSRGDSYATGGQHAMVGLRKVAVNEWRLGGDLA